MDDTSGQQLAGGYRVHGEPYAEPISVVGNAQVCIPNYLNFKRQAFRQMVDQCNSTTDVDNRQITLDTNGEKLPMALFTKGQALGGHLRFSNADVIILDKNGGGFDSNGEKLPMALFTNGQALGGHMRFCNADIIILDTNGDGFDSNDGEGLPMASFKQVLGGDRRFSNADVIIRDIDSDGFDDSNGENLRMASLLALSGHRRFYNADVIILDTDGDGFVSNGDSALSMASFQALGGHRDCNYANAGSTVNTDGNALGPNGDPLSMPRGRSYAHAEPRSPSTDGELRTSSVAGEFSYYYPYASAIQSVWRDNCVGVFKRVVDKLRQPRRHLYIALDLEFVAGASTNVRFRPICWNTWYDHLRAYVNGGDLLQVGLALAFELEHHRHGGPRAPSAPVIALEINLKFDMDAREYNDASITFLADQGHCLTEHRDRGVTMEQFHNDLLRHLPYGDDSVTWITYHGDRDFGFLLRLLLQEQGSGVLPPERATFMRQVRRKFPVFYDVRVLGQLEREGFAGGLAALAVHLGVRRIGGEHHAGSDALLTLSCFEMIKRRNEHKLHRLDTRQCLLSGMEEFNMAIKCARHIDDDSIITVQVRGHNFGEVARHIDELVTSNFKIVGVDVQLPHEDYDLMKISLKGIDTFQATIGFMNAEGMLAYGLVWKFHLSSRVDPAVTGGNNAYVRPGQLAWLMASCGATHNSNITWVTYQGSHGIACLIKSFLAADDLPMNWCSYIKHQRGLFPNLYDVGLIAQGCPDIGKHPFGLGLLMLPQALLVLRRYKTQSESPWFPHIAEAVRGQLMATQSCFWY